MSLSKPMQLVAFRLPAEERTRLEQIATARNVTLSYAIREGLKLYAREWAQERGDERVVTS